MTYTYDPTKIGEDGKDRMRFELGDTITDGGAVTTVLCDEEYAAVIGQASDWRTARLKCLEAICMKLSYEVDYSVTPLSYHMDARAERWKQMYKEAKDEMRLLHSGVSTCRREGGVFQIGMMENERARR